MSFQLSCKRYLCLVANILYQYKQLVAASISHSHVCIQKWSIIINPICYSREELMWSYKEGASILFPDKWEKFQKCIPEAERGDLLSAYYKRHDY